MSSASCAGQCFFFLQRALVPVRPACERAYALPISPCSWPPSTDRHPPPPPHHSTLSVTVPRPPQLVVCISQREADLAIPVQYIVKIKCSDKLCALDPSP